MKTPANPSPAPIEESIVALESLLGLSITIVDHGGIFHTPMGAALFPARRLSHRKNPVCDVGFHPKCIAHCRHAMNAKCQRVGEPFVESCWKGVVEVVVPLQEEGVHYGMLYAGSWREKVQPLQRAATFARQLMALPQWKGDGRDLMRVLKVFADGLMAGLAGQNALATIPDARGAQIRAWVRAHAAGPVRLSEIAAMLGLSRSRASVVIQESLGKSLPALVMEERIRRVKALLSSTRDPLTLIAEATGFCDAFHLSKAFSKATGISPRAFRRKHLVQCAQARFEG